MLPEYLRKIFLDRSDYESLPIEKDDAQTQVDWRSHLELLPLATWICCPKGGDVYLSLACRRLLGVVRTEEVTNNRWKAHIHPKDMELYSSTWENFIDSPAARFQAQVRWIRPDTGKSILLNIRVQRLNSGDFQGWVRANTTEAVLSKLEDMSR